MKTNLYAASPTWTLTQDEAVEREYDTVYGISERKDAWPEEHFWHSESSMGMIPSGDGWGDGLNGNTSKGSGGADVGVFL